MVQKVPPAGYKERKLTYGPYSPSRLISANCPAKFFAQYVRKDRVVGHTLASARGSAIHEVLAKITYAKMNNQILTARQVSDWVSESVAMFPAAYPQIDLVKEAADAYIANPSPYINSSTACERAFAVQLWEEESFFDEAVSSRAFVEVPYILPDGRHNPDCFFGGKLDQFSIDEETKTIVILDHKSTPSANVNEDHHFQVGAYAWLVSLFYPGYTIKTVIHYAHASLNFYAPPEIWDEADLAEMESYVMARIGALEAMQTFEAIPGTQCDYCHITQECPVFLKVREQKARGAVDLNVNSFEDLLRLAKELHVVDSLKSELNTALKKGVEKLAPQHGVDIGGIWYGFKVSDESVDWEATNRKIYEESVRANGRLAEGQFTEEEKPALEQAARYNNLDAILTAYGVNPNGFKNFQSQKMKNIWKFDKPGLIETLSQYVVKDRTTKFGGHKR